MQFLPASECEELATHAGLDCREFLAAKRIHSLKNAADFFYQS